MTTAESLRRTVETYTRELFARGPVLLPNAITATNGSVSWFAPARSGPLVDFVEYATVDTYRRWAVAGEYSAMLFDGALLQINYQVSGGQIVGHRLAYVPCPYRVDPTYLENEPLEDILDLYGQGSHGDVTMQSAIRFDFAPDHAAVGHPAAHLTLNVASCRMPCESPMHPAQFLRFVFRNFYPTAWTAHEGYFRSLTSRYDPSTVTSDERLEPHVAWRATDTGST